MSSRAVSVILPSLPFSADQVSAYACLVRDTCAQRLWTGQGFVLEPHQAFAHLAGQGIRIPVGTSVTLMPLRHPFEAAIHARSLALLTGQPVVAGIGIGSAEFVEALRGKQYESPASAVREYASVMRAVLDNEPPRFDSGYFDYKWSSPVFEHPPVQIGIGVLRQALAAVAGQTADVAITWLTPLPYLSTVLLPTAESAAARHGRTHPRFAAMVGVVLDRPGRDSVRTAFAGCGPHLTTPHYADMLRTAGIAVDESRPDLGAEQLVAEKVVLTGSVADVLAGIAEYWAAGVDEVILNVGGVRRLHGDEAALADLTELLGALSHP